MQIHDLTPEERAAVERIQKGQNWSSDPEILREVGEQLSELGDVQYGSVVVDQIRHQITARLQDGRKIMATVVITSV